MEAEILFIMVLALIVLGPRRLPEIGRQIGKALAELRRAKYEFTRQIEDEIRRIELEESQAKAENALAEKSAAQGAPENTILPPGSAPSGTVSVGSPEPGLASTPATNNG